jgi:hypothetical protein
VQAAQDELPVFARQCAFFTWDENQWVSWYVPHPRTVECHPYVTLSMNVRVVSKLADL